MLLNVCPLTSGRQRGAPIQRLPQRTHDDMEKGERLWHSFIVYVVTTEWTLSTFTMVLQFRQAL